MKKKLNKKQGKIYLAGAGPGDIGLITLRALEKIKTADVVVYDRLINDELLSFCRKDCEKIFVGKESGYHPIEQDKITQILIDKSIEGLDVVRLKGGNPFVFGRGSEEASDLRKAGIDFEIIPGITSGLAAPIYSGIPITQRGLITQCIFVTAHECPDKPGTQVEWDKLAKLKNTSLIIYMGAARIEEISKTLIRYGMDSSTPAAAIENATLPIQRTITARLDMIAEKFKVENFHSPVIIVISPAISLREDVCWFEKKLLFNKRMVIAGAEEHHKYYSDLLSESGAEIIFLPVMNIHTTDNNLNLNKRLSDDSIEWIIFSNESSVRSFFKILKRENLDARKLGHKKIAAIGTGICEMLESFKLIPDYYSDKFDAGLFQTKFIKANNLKNKKILFIQKEISNNHIYRELVNSDVIVEEVRVYDVKACELKQELSSQLNKKLTDILVFTDSGCIDFFFTSLGTERASNLFLNSKSVIIDPEAPEEVLADKLKSLKINTLCQPIGFKEFINKFV